MNRNRLNLIDVENIILTPEKRIQQLLMSSPKIKLNASIPARKYFRSGKEMISMADVYKKENNLEQAYILYIRFMTIFLELIKEHPDINSVPTEELNLNYRALREVFPEIENIKKKLLKQYSTEYELYQERKASQEFKEKREKKELNENSDLPCIKNDTEQQLNTILDNANIIKYT